MRLLPCIPIYAQAPCKQQYKGTQADWAQQLNLTRTRCRLSQVPFDMAFLPSCCGCRSGRRRWKLKGQRCRRGMWRPGVPFGATSAVMRTSRPLKTLHVGRNRYPRAALYNVTVGTQKKACTHVHAGVCKGRAVDSSGCVAFVPSTAAHGTWDAGGTRRRRVHANAQPQPKMYAMKLPKGTVSRANATKAIQLSNVSIIWRRYEVL